MTWQVMWRSGLQRLIQSREYNAAPDDPYAMKKKVVRGGSWKDVNAFIRSDARTAEYQNEQRSYVGFRCVRTQVGYNKKGK